MLEDRFAPATLTVNSLADNTTSDSVLTLREAIAIVNAGNTTGRSVAEQGQVTGTLGTNDTIQFASSVNTGTITLSGTRLSIAKSVTIAGTGADKLTIDGNDAVAVFFIDGRTNGAINVTIQNLKVSGGSAQTGSGTTTDTVDNSIRGGGLFNDSASVTIKSCYFSANTADFGGAIYNFKGTLNLENSTVDGNQALVNSAGVVNAGGTANIRQSTIMKNFGGGDVAIGGLFNGPAPAAAGGAAGTLNIIQCTIVENFVTNTQNFSNAAAGIYTDASSTTVIKNSIVAGNLNLQNTTNDSADIHGSSGFTVSGNNNYIGSSFAAGNFVNGVDGNIVPSSLSRHFNVVADPALNGGAMPTYRLLDNSPAFDKGNNSDAPFSTDQRGQARIADGPDGDTTATVDIGSVEGSNASVPDTTPPTIVSFDDGDTDNIVAVNQTLTYTVTFSEDIASSTVVAADFNNEGSATITIGTITETTAGVFTVQVTPTTAGTLKLRIPSTATITDVANNALAVFASDNDTLLVQGPDVTTNPFWKTYTAADAFLLHSKPGANRIIYLDFDGHTVTGTAWNDDFNGGATFTIPAWSMDTDRTTFSTTEKDKIVLMWRMIAEDFAPFDIDVTTQDPGLDALRFTGSGDTVWGTRAIIGPDPQNFVSNSPQQWPAGGGVADQNAFKSASEIHSFSWNGDRISNPESTLPVTVSHEVGHTFNLEHDGTTSPVDEYYGGHGSGVTSWGPIMGEPDNISLTQWSRNTYPNADRAEDDLAIITGAANGVVYRTDDFGNTRDTASALNTTGAPVYGIIEKNTDVDYFSFYAKPGTVVIQINPLADFTANLDVQARLFDSAGTLLQTVNPTGSLDAPINFTVTTAGTYFVEIDGVGKTPVLPTGYTDYGSLGNYRIVIAGNSTPPLPPFTGALIVDTTSDVSDGNFSAGNLSIREAIEIANQDPAASFITFAEAMNNKTITLLNGELPITSTLTITGLGAKSLTISGANSTRIFRIDDGISGNFAVTIKGMTLTNGKTTTGDGGAIDNAELLTLDDVAITASTAQRGGGIFNRAGATLALGKSTISGNRATDLDGGGLYNAGTATVKNVTFSGNLAEGSGGGIANAGTLTLTNATLTLNGADVNGLYARGSGAGLFTSQVPAGTTLLFNSLVAGNFLRGQSINVATIVSNDLGGLPVDTASSNNLISEPSTNGDLPLGLIHGVNGNIVGDGDGNTLFVDTILDVGYNPTTNTYAAPFGLIDNGGSTKTHALVQNSLAIGGGSTTVTGYSKIDQRGTPRDLTDPDIGAYEVQHPLAPVGVPGTYAETFTPKGSPDTQTAFVKGLYKSTLLREADADGLAFWVGFLNAGNTISTVAFGFVNSDENRGNQIRFYYRYFLGREANNDEVFNVWVPVIKSSDEGAVMTRFALSDEFSGKNNNDSFVNLMYYALLGRQAETQGFNDWINSINQGLSREAVVTSFLRSDESIFRIIDSFFGSYLKRPADAANRAGFHSSIKNGTSFGTVAAFILGSTEFYVAADSNR